MSAPRPPAAPPARPRRVPTATSRRAEREHIVRVIHSHPIYLGWLREQIAAALLGEAERLTEAGHGDAGAKLAARALRHRAGEA